MANWRRGFFRIWILLTILWIAVVGLFFISPMIQPYVPAEYFTYDRNDHFERLIYGSPRYTEVTKDVVDDKYEIVPFNDIAQNLTFFSPNVVVVTVDGKKYKMTFTNKAQKDRAGLVTSLTSYIATQQPDRPIDEIRARVEQAVPAVVVSNYRTPEMQAQEKADAAMLYQTALGEQRINLLIFVIALAIAPPIIVLLLGVGLAWALKGFRRDQQASR